MRYLWPSLRYTFRIWTGQEDRIGMCNKMMCSIQREQGRKIRLIVDWPG